MANGLGCSPPRTSGAIAPGTWRLGASSPTRGCKEWLRQQPAATSVLCVAPSTRWAPRYPRLADPETHAGLSAIHGAVCEEEVMLKCTRGMNEVDAYVEHGVHGYVPMAVDDWSGARYGGRPSAAESN